MKQTMKAGVLTLLMAGVFVTNASAAVRMNFQTQNSTVIVESPAPEVGELTQYQSANADS